MKKLFIIFSLFVSLIFLNACAYDTDDPNSYDKDNNKTENEQLPIADVFDFFAKDNTRQINFGENGKEILEDAIKRFSYGGSDYEQLETDKFLEDLEKGFEIAANEKESDAFVLDDNIDSIGTLYIKAAKEKYSDN